MGEPRHLHKSHLSCNSPECRANVGSIKDDAGNRLINKFLETCLDEHDDVRCLHCGNWICGFYDAYGDPDNARETMTQIKHSMDILQRTATKYGRIY